MFFQNSTHPAGVMTILANKRPLLTEGYWSLVTNVSGKKPKRADYILRYKRDFMLAVVEAKASYKNPSDGLQQAKEYAEILGVKFAYSTNGHGIVEHDYLTGRERETETFPSPDDLWKKSGKQRILLMIPLQTG